MFSIVHIQSETISRSLVVSGLLSGMLLQSATYPIPLIWYKELAGCGQSFPELSAKQVYKQRLINASAFLFLKTCFKMESPPPNYLLLYVMTSMVAPKKTQALAHYQCINLKHTLRVSSLSTPHSEAQ